MGNSASLTPCLVSSEIPRLKGFSLGGDLPSGYLTGILEALRTHLEERQAEYRPLLGTEGHGHPQDLQEQLAQQ